MGSTCFKTLCRAQTVTYRHMWAESDSWHVFCMVIMRSTFSQSGWHAESQETADDEGLGLGQGSGADWAVPHQGRGEELCCSTYQQPDAQGGKSPPVRRQMKLLYVLQLHAIKICQSVSAVLKLVLWNVQQETSSWTMIWMQCRLIPLMVKVWHVCNFPTAHVQQQYGTRNIHRARGDQRLQKETPKCRGGEQQTQNTCQRCLQLVLIRMPPYQKGHLYTQKMDVQLTNPTTKHCSSHA